MFSFCSVCFLFRSTAQFWFGPLRADGVWQVRISGATHLCLIQGCGLSSCQPCRSRRVCLLSFLLALSFYFLFLFSSFLLSLSVCLFFLYFPFFPLSVSLITLGVCFCLPVPLLFSSSFCLAIFLPFLSISLILFLKRRGRNQLLGHLEA